MDSIVSTGMIVGATTTSAVLLCGVSYVAIGKTFQTLASMNKGLTFLEEGMGRLFMVNGKLSRPIGSLPGYCRAYLLDDFVPTDDPRDRWTWVKDTRPHEENLTPQWLRDLNLFKGIVFIGIGTPYQYPFRWTRAHFPKPKGGSGEVVPNDGTGGMMVIGAQSEDLDYVFLNDVAYHVIVPEPETKKGERLPLDVSFSVTLQVVNEVKALLGTHQWFEMLVQRFIPSGKNFIGSKEYDNLIDLHKDSSDLHKDACFTDFVKEMLDDYGVAIKKIQVYSLDPDNAQREATVAVYKAKQAAEVTEIKANAEASAIKKVQDAIAQHNFGPALRFYDALRDSKLPGTIVLGGGAIPNISIPTTHGNQSGKNDPPMPEKSETDT